MRALAMSNDFIDQSRNIVWETEIIQILKIEPFVTLEKKKRK